MGARLVKQAIAFAVDVPLRGNEFRLLIHMAVTALDEDDPPRYFDSRESSALALGRRVPDGGSAEADAERGAAFQAVKVAVAGLVAVGALRRLKQGKAGQRAEFAIALDLGAARSSAEYRRRRGVGNSYPRSVGNSYPTGYAIPTAEGYAVPTPKEPLRNHKDQTTGISASTSSTTSLGHVESESAEAMKETSGRKEKAA